MYPFFKIATAFVFPRADFSHGPVLRTELSESSPQPQVNQENVSLTLAALCVRKEGGRHALERLSQEERGRDSHSKSAVFSVVSASSEEGAGHREYSSSVIKSRARATFPKADYRIWIHQHFSQLSICQLCKSFLS